MKRFLTLLLAVYFCGMSGQKIDSLVVNYYENFPYAYSEGGILKGIEIDIVREYVGWLKSKKNLTVVVTYNQFKEFGQFYNAVKSGGPKVIGLGSVTHSPAREKDILFSPPYLQNLPVLITSGRVQTLRSKNSEEVTRVFGNMNAVTVAGSSHINFLNSLKDTYLPKMQIRTVDSQTKVLESIISDATNFGYVDIVAYWSFLKSNPGKFLKIQKVFNEPREDLAFILPITNGHSSLLSEFFESGFGFTSTKTYHQILEKYLGYEIIDAVELK